MHTISYILASGYGSSLSGDIRCIRFCSNDGGGGWGQNHLIIHHSISGLDSWGYGMYT